MNENAVLLRDLMVSISEKCYCAYWMDGLEKTLWSYVQFGPGKWGNDAVTQSDIYGLTRLSMLCGGWIVWGENEEAPIGESEVFITIDQWLSIVDG